jgi:hypothetical protein
MNKTLGEISNTSAPAFKRGFHDALKTARKSCPFYDADDIIAYNRGFNSGLDAYDQAAKASYTPQRKEKHT